MKQNALVLSLTLVLASATVARAQVAVFEDSFESGNLAQWTGQFGAAHHGQIVTDPLNAANHVLTFTGVNAAGDIFSRVAIPANTAAGRYVLSFDFLALPIGGVTPSEYGGFAGVATAPGFVYPAYWVGGTYAPALNVPSSVATVLATDGQWHHYEIDFTEIIPLDSIYTFNVMLEDWYDRGSIPGDVYFDNVRVLVGSPSQSLDQLVSAVQNSDLAANRKRPLLAALDAASASLDRGDTAGSISQLRAFNTRFAHRSNARILFSQIASSRLRNKSSTGIAVARASSGRCSSMAVQPNCRATLARGLITLALR